MKFISPILSQATGSVGASTYSRNRGGAYIRNRSRPVQPLTVPQQNVRLAVKTTANAFATQLTPSQIAGWNAYAAANPVPNGVGGTMILSAIAMFNKVNAALALAGGAGALVLDSPGAVTFLPALSAGPTFGLAAGVITMDLLNTVDFAIGDIICAYITKSTPPSRTPVHQPSLPIVYVTLAAIPTVPNNYIHTEADPFAVSRATGSPFQARFYWIRGGNISTPVFVQGLAS